MKLLFILDTVEFPLAPTAGLARQVAGQLAENGHIVHLLELWDGETVPPAMPGCQQFPLSFADERVMNRVLEFGKPGGTPVPLRLMKLLVHPAALGAAVRQLGLRRPRRISAAARRIEQLDGEHHYDAAIAVAAPYAGCFALAAARFGGKKAGWQMDPYAANQDYDAPGAWAKEQALDAALDKLFVAPTAAADFAPGRPLEAFAAKMQVVDFPALLPAPPAQRPANPRIRCVFVGSLYPEMRTPHFALELFLALNDPSVELVFVGGGWNNYPSSLLTPYKAALGDRLLVTGPVPHEEARRELAAADVLVSLGNAAANQVPSKLFEYFAAGKPILHLAKLQNDPCLPYLARWPLACVLQESEGAAPAVCETLRAFLRQKGRSRLAYEQAAELFAANTPAFVARQLEQQLKEQTP